MAISGHRPLAGEGHHPLAGEGHRPLLTVGHGTLAAEAFAALLAGARVDLLLDVRRYPGSRRWPHLAGEQMAQWLPASGVDYGWDARLGGRRRVPRDEQVDTWWQAPQFRAYAAHTRTPDFTAALAELLDAAARRRVAVMCSESLWWRCHRRLIADVVRLRTAVPVLHLGHDGRLGEHPVASGARVRHDGLVTWDGSVSGPR